MHRDDDFNDDNPYPIMVMHASISLGEYQIKDVSYNIQSIRDFGQP